jgi:cobyrinic acid a,c-diamide synthase
VRIAVARDKAFCFYYEDSLEALTEMGAELVPFSPLHDAALPPDIHGLYIGGGYPELYAEALSKNAAMRASVKSALEQRIPCIAECGGFMYLTESIGDAPMVGFLPGRSFDTAKLVRFGYVYLKAKEDTMLCRVGEGIRGMSFTTGTASTSAAPSPHRNRPEQAGTACLVQSSFTPDIRISTFIQILLLP